MMPIIISRNRQVNCIVQNDKTYCEKHVPTASDLQFGLIMIILLILWYGGLFLILKKVIVDDELSGVWAFVYIITAPVLMLIMSLFA